MKQIIFFERLESNFKSLLETPKQMSFCEYCKTSKNTIFEEHLRMAASEVTLGSDCLGLSFWTVAFKTILTQ